MLAMDVGAVGVRALLFLASRRSYSVALRVHGDANLPYVSQLILASE